MFNLLIIELLSESSFKTVNRIQYVYFSGQANITVEPHKHPKQYPQLWPFEAGIDIYSIEFEYLR